MTKYIEAEWTKIRTRGGPGMGGPTIERIAEMSFKSGCAWMLFRIMEGLDRSSDNMTPVDEQFMTDLYTEALEIQRALGKGI